MHFLLLLFPALIATLEGIMSVNDTFCRQKAKAVRTSSKILFKKKLEKLNIENAKTRSALVDFGRERISAIKGELSEAEKVILKFNYENVIEIDKMIFPREVFSDDDKALAFGVFGTKAISRCFDKRASFSAMLSSVFSGTRELEEACKFQQKTAIMRGFMDSRIQILVALRQRAEEGMKVIKFLREKLGLLLKKSENMEKIDPMIFVQIRCTALTLKKVAEIEICSVEGTLSREAELLFRKILLEVS